MSHGNHPALPPANDLSSEDNEWANGADAGQSQPGVLSTTGLYAARLVTQPQFQPGDTVYSTMHEGTPGNPGSWGEIGWVWNQADGQPYVFTSSGAVGGQPQTAPQYVIAPNDELYFEIIYNGNNNWANLLYWPADGGWVVVSQYQLTAAYTTDTNVDSEIYTYYDGQFTVMPNTWIYATEIYWCPSSGCGWYDLDTTTPSAEFVVDDAPNYPSLSPYYTGYVYPFYYWDVYGG